MAKPVCATTGPRLESGYDIRTVQGLLGHRDGKTTMIYTHVMNRQMSEQAPLRLTGFSSISKIEDIFASLIADVAYIREVRDSTRVSNGIRHS